MFDCWFNDMFVMLAVILSRIALCRFHAPPAMQAYPRTAHLFICPALSRYECAEKRVLLQYQSRPSGVLKVAGFS